MAIIRRRNFNHNDKFISLNSTFMKACILMYLRFKRGYIVSTEQYVTCGSGDVCGYNDKEVVEVEIKISKSDLRADKKKSKHKFYKDYPQGLSPNKFYYAVPTFLVEDAIKLCEEINNDYGVIEVRIGKQIQDGYDIPYAEICSIRKRAKTLHNMDQVKMKEYFAKRISNELITFYQALYRKIPKQTEIYLSE